MNTTDQVHAAQSAAVEARRQITIDRLAPIFEDYRARRVHPEFRYERLVAGGYSVFVSLPGDTSNGPRFLCEISRGWLRLGGNGWSYSHPITGQRSHRNRHDAAFECFRKLLRRA